MDVVGSPLAAHDRVFRRVPLEDTQIKRSGDNLLDGVEAAWAGLRQGADRIDAALDRMDSKHDHPPRATATWKPKTKPMTRN